MDKSDMFKIVLIILSVIIQISAQTVYNIEENLIKDTISNPKFSFSTISLNKISLPKTISPNTTILRKKFGFQKYTFYKSDISNKYFPEFNSFKKPSSKSIYFFLKKKFFRQESVDLENDISNLYFDNDFIYAENINRLYYFDLGWKTINKYNPDIHKFKFTTTPESSSVFINEVFVGTTPCTVSMNNQKYNFITFKKENYYYFDIFLINNNDANISKNIVLTKIPQAPIGTYIDPECYTFESTSSFKKLSVALHRERVKYLKLIEILRNSIVTYEKEYPAIPKKDEFENDSLFLKRLDLYKRIRANGKFNLTLKNSADIYEIERTILKLETEINKIEQRIYYSFFSGDKIQLEKYNSHLGQFSLYLNFIDKGHYITFNGLLFMPPHIAKLFKLNTSNSLLKLTYKSVISSSDKLHLKTIQGYKYNKISILFRGAEYTIIPAKKSNNYSFNSENKRKEQY